MPVRSYDYPSKPKFTLKVKRTKSAPRYSIKRAPSIMNVIHPFKRTVGLAFDLNQGGTTYGFKTAVAALSPSSGSGNGFGMAFQFSLLNVISWHDASGTSATWAVPSVSEFQGLFSQYRIKKIVLRMVWDQNVTNSLANFNAPIFNIVTDTDDAVPPLGPTDLVQRQGVRLIALGAGNRSQIQTHTIYPRTMLSTATTSGVSSQSQARNQWFSTNVMDVTRYGVKFRWDQMANSNVPLGSMLCYVDYYLEFKGFR